MTHQAKPPKFSPEVREHRSDHPSEWAAVAWFTAKIGYTAQTLSNWAKQDERESAPQFRTVG